MRVQVGMHVYLNITALILSRLHKPRDLCEIILNNGNLYLLVGDLIAWCPYLAFAIISIIYTLEC